MILIQPTTTRAAVATAFAAGTELLDAVRQERWLLSGEEYLIDYNQPGNTVEKVTMMHHGPKSHPA